MTIERGGIYLANLNPAKPSEPGKVRPVLVLQADALTAADHPTVIVLPLTTYLVDDAFPLRFRLPSRDGLHHVSDVMCDQIRAITRGRITSALLTRLEVEEVVQIERQLLAILDCEN